MIGELLKWVGIAKLVAYLRRRREQRRRPQR